MLPTLTLSLALLAQGDSSTRRYDKVTTMNNFLGFYWLFMMLVKDIRKDFGLVFFNRVVSRYCQSYGYIPSKKLRSGKFPTPTLPSWLIRTIYSDLMHIFICTTNDWGRVDIRCFHCTVLTPDRFQEAFRAVYYVTGSALCSVLCCFVLLFHIFAPLTHLYLNMCLCPCSSRVWQTCCMWAKAYKPPRIRFSQALFQWFSRVSTHSLSCLAQKTFS